MLKISFAICLVTVGVRRLMTTTAKQKCSLVQEGSLPGIIRMLNVPGDGNKHNDIVHYRCASSNFKELINAVVFFPGDVQVIFSK